MIKVAAAIFERNGEIFICQRRAGKHLEFLWEFPGGKVEPGETFEDCLRRECQEELGIRVSSPIPFDHIEYSYPEFSVELVFFRCRIESGEPRGQEGQNVRWIKKSELSRYSFCPADQGVVKKLLEEAVIEYGSYLRLGANAIPKELQVDFLSYLEYFINEGNNTLRDNLRNTLSVEKFPSRSDDEIIEGILACSLKELEKKRNNENYYICNAICLLNVINRIFNNDLFHILKDANTPTIALHNYEHILKWMLIDADELQNLYQNNLKKDKKDFQYTSSIDTRYIHYLSVHQVLRQSLFGQISYDSFADMEISASIAIIRQLVELRIRRAFGVLSYVDESNDNLLPLDLSRVFECIKKYKENIEFPLKLENIERIYKWANLYVHSGKTEFSWIPYYIENKLRELSFGQQPNDGWNVNNGIVVSDRIIQDIHAELLKDKPKLKIFPCLPECARK